MDVVNMKKILVFTIMALVFAQVALAACDDTGKVMDIYTTGTVTFEGESQADFCKDGVIFEVKCDGDGLAYDFEPCTCGDEYSCVESTGFSSVVSDVNQYEGGGLSISNLLLTIKGWITG